MPVDPNQKNDETIPVLHWTHGELTIQHIRPWELRRQTRELSPIDSAAFCDIVRERK